MLELYASFAVFCEGVCADVSFLKGLISNILEEDVVQPLLVTTSALELSTETVCLLLRIDDYVQTR